jgi:hypothetical protein
VNTVTYNYVLERACELTGRVYPPQTEEEPAFRGFIAMALRKIWEKFPWPDTVTVEKVYLAQPWTNLVIAYNSGSVVYMEYDKNTYISTQYLEGPPPIDGVPGIASGNIYQAGAWYKVQRVPSSSSTWLYDTQYSAGDTVIHAQSQKVYFAKSNSQGASPDATNSNYWTEITPYQFKFNKLVDYAGATRTVQIGEVLSITTKDPRESGGIDSVGFSVVGDDVILLSDVGFVYVTYRQVPPGLSTVPTTIPYRFSEYVAQKAAATMLLVDGKTDAAAAMAGLAEDTLNDECDKVSNQEGLIQKVTVFTR